MSGKPRPQVVLCILDGIGWRSGPGSEHGNAIVLANPSYYQSLLKNYPFTTLRCSGLDVGLPEGQMGNSEVGHLTIGAGRVIDQELVRISHSISSGEFSRLHTWQQFTQRIRSHSGRLHLLGLVSPGGVHSHTDHLYGIVDAARRAGLQDVAIHVFLDGRDTEPRNGLGYVQELQRQLDRIGMGTIASVMGRYYAMDRDKRWERVQKAWQALVHGEGPTVSDAAAAIAASYAQGVTDEFVLPAVVCRAGKPVATVEDGDGVFFWNFRADRARELTWAFNRDDFDGFARLRRPDIAYLCMSPYDETLDLPVLYRPEFPRNGLAEIFAEHGLKNLRTAETEKYAHVTYFFNGGREKPYAGEERILIPSPKVATYDLQPQMSAPEVARTVGEQAAGGGHDVIIVNFANGDMVGHTGVLAAAIEAVRALDALLAKIIPPIIARGATVLVTADHGNCDEMIAPDGSVLTAHSLNPVPFIVVGERWRGCQNLMRDGPYGLADIAPTILKLIEIKQPSEMTGRSIL
jgi:2,3-bisphosphoglycerate-independent phosphoglycerate mutase